MACHLPACPHMPQSLFCQNTRIGTNRVVGFFVFVFLLQMRLTEQLFQTAGLKILRIHTNSSEKERETSWPKIGITNKRGKSVNKKTQRHTGGSDKHLVPK